MPEYITASDVYTYQVYHLTTTVISSLTVNQFIDDAESVINGYCAKLYSVPFTSTSIPFLIKKLTRQLSGYYCLEYLHQQQNRNISTQVAEMGKNAITTLKEIYDDKLRLIASLTTGGTGVITPNTAISLKATYTDMPTIINMDDEYEWHVPYSLLDDVESRRSSAD